MKITVIGATGATGRKVVERALELGHEVIAVARRPEAHHPHFTSQRPSRRCPGCAEHC
ncbi:NAD(P)H-binding protein [Peribacillus muralis]|uniref:NAD(P)H-binding protein n=1 Tax=Peribacillus muralis TaxID=264697 RepID=UPI000B0B4538|nr:NAD(P)H-binding protein [Peribacillus muralis]